MWSLGQWLAGLAETDHLPSGFSAENGIRSLFPAGLGTVSITLLKNYLYAQDCSVSTSEITGQYHIRADGSGRWLFQGFIVGLGAGFQTTGQALGNWGAGFIFVFSTNSTGHGTVLATTESNAPPGDFNQGQGFEMYGTDPWILEHWPSIFPQGVGCYISHADGDSDLPPLTNAAINQGFASLASLNASDVVPGVTVMIWLGPIWGPGSDVQDPLPLVWRTPT